MAPPREPSVPSEAASRTEDASPEPLFLRQALGRSPVALFRLRLRDLSPSWVSENFEDVTGCSREALLDAPGDVLERVHPDERQGVSDALRQLGAGRGERAVREFRFRADGGEYRWLRGAAARVGSSVDQGLEEALVGHLVEVTARRRAERELSAHRRRLREAQSLARVGNWEWYPESDDVYWSEEEYRIFGYEPDEVEPSYAAFRRRVHPDDRDRVERLKRRAVGGGASFDVEFRLLLPDGSVRWVREQARVETSDRGDTRRLVGVTRDVTEARERREALRRSEQRQRLLLEQLPAVVWTTDRELRFTSSSGAGLRKMGLEPGEVVGSTLHEFFGTEDEDFPPIREHVRALDGESTRYQTEWDDRVFDTRLEPLVDDEGRATGVVGVAFDITERVRAEEERRRTEERYRSLFEDSPDPILIAREDGEILRVNDAFLEEFGYERHELDGLGADDLYVDRAERREFLRRLEEDGHVRNFQATVRTKDGERRVHQLTASYQDGAGDEGRLIRAIGRDVTEARERREALRRSGERYRALFEHNVAGVFRSTPEGTILECNAALAEMLGYDSASDLEGRDARLLYPSDEDRSAYMDRLRDQGRVINEELELERRDGTPMWALENSVLTEDPTTGETVIQGTLVDVSEQKELEEQLRHQALHDPLTGLANRALLTDRVEQGLARSRRHGGFLGLLMVDVDQFKRINDNLGHTTGDRVLEELAGRLEDVVRDEDTVARWGGDEFVILLPELADPNAIEPVVDRIREAVRRPIEAGGEELRIDLGIGAVVHGEEAEWAVRVSGAEELLRFGTLALHRAKEGAGTGFYWLEPEEETDETGRIRLEQDLRRALERDEIVPYFQPIVRLEDRAVVGTEVLARWQHPERGLLSAAEFVPLAEEFGLIHDLGAAVFRAGVEQGRAFTGPDDDGEGPTLFFNVSAEQLEASDFARELGSWLEETGLSPGRVVLELTETSLMQSPGRVERIRDLGVQIFVDDFGTEYSTFTYLRDLRLDGLKIDMSFVQGLGRGGGDAALVDTMLTLGDRLGLIVVAEGVETEEQRERLLELGSEAGQGHLFARPMPGEECVDWLRSSQAD